METQAANLRNMFTGLAFTDPQQHARMAADIGVQPMRGVSGGYGSDTPMSDPEKTFTDAGAQTHKGVHATAGSQTDAGVSRGDRPLKKRPTLTDSEVHTEGYDPKNDPFCQHVERVFEGIGSVYVPDFINDGYDAEIMGHYSDFKRKEESMHEAHRKDIKERDKKHVKEVTGLHNFMTEKDKHYAKQIERSKDTVHKYRDELSRLNQELQNARTRPAMAKSGIQVDDHDIRREHEYETAQFTSRYNENNFNTGDKRRPSPFREQMRGREPPDKYNIGG
jgi:hypothetical protein